MGGLMVCGRKSINGMGGGGGCEKFLHGNGERKGMREGSGGIYSRNCSVSGADFFPQAADPEKLVSFSLWPADALWSLIRWLLFSACCDCFQAHSSSAAHYTLVSSLYRPIQLSVRLSVCLPLWPSHTRSTHRASRLPLGIHCNIVVIRIRAGQRLFVPRSS